MATEDKYTTLYLFLFPLRSSYGKVPWASSGRILIEWAIEDAAEVTYSPRLLPDSDYAYGQLVTCPLSVNVISVDKWCRFFLMEHL